MKIVIANPPWPGEGYGARTNVRWPHRRKDKYLAFPVYLSYASAFLKTKGFDVYAVDAVQKEMGIFNFVSHICEKKPDLVVLEISTPSIAYDLETAYLLKEKLPDAKIAFWGPHASFFHKELVSNYNFIDFCIRGELEETLLDLCMHLSRKENLNLVSGITFKNAKKVFIAPDRELSKNLDLMPFPDRESFKLEDYRQGYYSGKNPAMVISSRGCPYQCTFCLWPQTVGGRKFRPRSAKNVVDEIEYLVKKHNADEIIFDDDTFTLDRQRVIDICNELFSRNINIKWMCMARVNTVDEEMLKLMKSAGCYQVCYGFESGSQKILDSMKKKITLQQISNAVKLTKKIGLAVAGSFIFGMPEESRQTIKETLRFAKKLKADYVQFALTAPFPGTELYETAKEHNLLEIDSWSDLDGTKGLIAKTFYLDRKQMKGLIRKAYLSYYTSPGIIWTNFKSAVKNRNFRRMIKGALSIFSRIIYYKK